MLGGLRTKPVVLRPARPTSKGNVERTIGYAETSFLPLRGFAWLEDLQGQHDAWADRSPGNNVRRQEPSRAELSRAAPALPAKSSPSAPALPARSFGTGIGRTASSDEYRWPPLKDGLAVRVLFGGRSRICNKELARTRIHEDHPVAHCRGRGDRARRLGPEPRRA